MESIVKAAEIFRVIILVPLTVLGLSRNKCVDLDLTFDFILKIDFGVDLIQIFIWWSV